jgi:general nucleoside transport system ATP-binding protein
MNFMENPAEPIVRLHKISKYFPGVLANDKVDFELRKGDIHTLLGENGAGKSTLMNILDGLYKPDEGEINIDGKPVVLHNPYDAMQMGIGMIHQHFMLVDTFTVLENVILGIKSEPFYIDKKKTAARIREISDRYNFGIDPFLKIWQLSVGEQQKVEIIKTLFRGANVLILDEPTAVLTPQEVDAFFEILEKMVEEGKSIIFISHKLNEVMKISDRITVMRKGKVVGIVNREDTSKEKLAEMMVGRKVLFSLDRKPLQQSREVLRLEDVQAFNEKGIKALKGINLSIKSGEIFGIAGVSGNGQQILSDAIAGLKSISAGKILLKGKDIAGLSPRSIAKLRLNYIPPDRLKVGLIPNLSSVDNAILRCYVCDPISQKCFIDYSKANSFTEKLIKEYDIMVPRRDAPVKLLSGGNMQKLLFAREAEEKPEVLIAVNPTRGLDIGATEFIRNELVKQRNNGVAVLLISGDLDEIFMLSDRIGVIFEGEILDVMDIDDADLERVGLLMAGLRDDGHRSRGEET